MYIKASALSSNGGHQSIRGTIFNINSSVITRVRVPGLTMGVKAMRSFYNCRLCFRLPYASCSADDSSGRDHAVVVDGPVARYLTTVSHAAGRGWFVVVESKRPWSSSRVSTSRRESISACDHRCLSLTLWWMQRANVTGKTPQS